MEIRLNGDHSLNSPLGESGSGEWQDLLADHSPTPEEVLIRTGERTTRSRWLKEALNTLDPRERTIIRKRQLRDHGATLEALGKDLGVSKERVRQLEMRALNKLKTALFAQAQAENTRHPLLPR